MIDPLPPRPHCSLRCKIAAVGLFLVLLWGMMQSPPSQVEISDNPQIYGRGK